jgi:hypothetical protein
MTCPGGLREWDGAHAAWEAKVAQIAERVGVPDRLARANAVNTAELRVPDWPAVPARVRGCLGRQRADRLLDARDGSEADVGRRLFHEEYAEWRLVRGENGPMRFELTTELADYWELLAAHNPARAMELVEDFARERVGPSAIFGDHDPFDRASTEEARAAAFRRQMVGIDPGGPVPMPGPYNSGAKAITCLSRSDNTLEALVRLAAAAVAAGPQLVIDPVSGEPRFPTGSEAISQLPPGNARDCRNSDPVVVERIVRLVTEGRLVRFDDPIGVYIVDVQTSELVDPSGGEIPREWWRLSRAGTDQRDDLPRYQRLTLEIPRDAGFDLWQVRSRRTDLPIRSGADVAELVQLAVYLRTGPPADTLPEVVAVPAPAVGRCTDDRACVDVHHAARELDQAEADS